MNNPPTTADALAFHFGGAEAPPGWVYQSTWMLLLDRARSETGRHGGTGALLDESKSGSWLGATAYLILLDQLGKCLKPATALNPPGPSSVERALQMWSGLPEAEIRVLTAVRNALAHDFALSNQNANPDYRHRFAYDRHPTRLVAFPAQQWSGDYGSQDHVQDTTGVSLLALGDLVESVVARVEADAVAQNLEITLRGGPSELILRYGIVYRAEHNA